MIRESYDKTSEVNLATGIVEIWCKDYCDAFEQETDRMFASKECWYCIHGNFGIYTDRPKKNGICEYRDANRG
jgi:hypothetical protein